MSPVLPPPDPQDRPGRRAAGRDVTMLRGFIMVLMVAMAVCTVLLCATGRPNGTEGALIAIAWGLIVGAYIAVGHLPRGRR